MSTSLSRMKRPFFRELALHALAWLVCVAGLFHVYDLRHADLEVPIALDSWGDGVYYGAQVKIMLETGWVYHHPDLGAPFGLDLYDFAQFDALHLFIMKLIGYVWPHWAVILNVFFLLTFGLSASTSLALLRHLRLPALLALPLALAFAFQPYHFDRGQGHIMLAAYYHVPLMAFALVWLLQPAGLRDAEGLSLWRSWRFRLSILFAFLGIFGGIYYAFFFCLFYLVAGIYSAASLRQWAPLVQAAVLVGEVGLGFGCNLAPNALYWTREGGNRIVSTKPFALVEKCSLRLTPMLLPHRHHRVELFRKVTYNYEKYSGIEKYEPQSAIGLAGGLGLAVLLALGLFGRHRAEGSGLLPRLGVVILASLLVATLSGFGALFALLVTPQIHAYGRMVPCLALFGLIAVGSLMDRWQLLIRPVWRGVALAAFSALIVFDVLPGKLDLDPSKARTQFAAAIQFGEAIQAAVPKGTAIYTLPSSRFPFERYDYLSGYLFTQGLRWSSPAMINRRGAVWQEEIDRLPPKAFLEQLYLMGFGGLILDPRAKETPSMKAVARQLAAAGLTPLSDGQGCSFYDLRGLASKFRARHEPAQWERMRTLTSLPVYARCWTRILPQDADGIRWCPSKTGMVDLVNTDADPVEVELSLRARMSSAGLRITGSVLRGDSAEVQNGLTSSRRFTLPPGSHRLTFHELGDAPRVDSPHGSVWFGVEQFSIQPATDPTPVAGRSRP